MIKYKVNLNYYEFVFDDAGTAVDFALTAKRFTIKDSLYAGIELIDVEKPEVLEDDVEEVPEDDVEEVPEDEEA